MNSQSEIFSGFDTWWYCDTCNERFSPGSEQDGIWKTIGARLCIPCIGKIDARIAEINKQKDAQMKQFNASEFISNEETPVIARNGSPVEIITVTGRGKRTVVGYIDDSDMTSTWCDTGMYNPSNTEDPWDLFFAPKLEVVHVYQYCNHPPGTFTAFHGKEGALQRLNASLYTYLGTITGPIVPPEKSEVAK